MPRSRVQEQQVDVAVLGPGDILGEAALLGLTAHATSAVVSSAQLSVLQVPLTDLQQLLHAEGLQVGVFVVLSGHECPLCSRAAVSMA
jgi:CRP-like cAMP-binding protein